MSDVKESKKSDIMRKIKIEKVVVNCSVGKPGDPLTRAVRVLKELTDQDPVISAARITVRTFSIRRNDKIACHVSVAGPKAREVLEKALAVKEFELPARNFSDSGNFGFGIDEHIDLGLKYDPQVGIYGMDIYVVLKRPGYRVSHRRRRKNRVGIHHRVSKQDAIDWFKSEFGGTIREKDSNKW